MLHARLPFLAVCVISLLSFCHALPHAASAQDWAFHGASRGVLKVADLSAAGYDARNDYAEGLLALALEVQIMDKMPERVGLSVRLEVFPLPQWWHRFFIPTLERPPEEQEWDISLYAANKEVGFVPQKSWWLRLRETSVSDKHWSIRGQKE